MADEFARIDTRAEILRIANALSMKSAADVPHAVVAAK
jgi:hypothetical protein